MSLLIQTSTPKLISNKILGTSLSAIKLGSDLCEFASIFETEFDLNIEWERALSSPNIMNGYRRFTKKLLLNGPNLDTQTLIEFVDRVQQTLPPPVYNELSREIDESLNRANNRVLRRPAVPATGQLSDYMYDDEDFLNQLVDRLLLCARPCNYLRPISDNLAHPSIPQQLVGPNTAPLWDRFSELIQTPMNIAMVTFNKVSQNVQRNVIGLSNAVEGVFRDSLQPFFPEDRVEIERGLVEGGGGIDATSHGYDLVTDTWSYFKTSEIQSEYLANTQRAFADCFRMFEYHRRFNPYDVDMNKTTATKNQTTVNVEGTPVNVDYQGKKIQPLTKPQADTIEEKLETVEEEYPYDDLPDEDLGLPQPGENGAELNNPLFPSQEELPEGAEGEGVTEDTPNSSGTGDDARDKYLDILNDPNIPSRPTRTSDVREGEVALTSYTWNRNVDSDWDSNSGTFKGNANNLLRVNSLALSRGTVNHLKSQGSLKLGDKIYVTNDIGEKKFLGYWDDTSPSSKPNIDFFHVNPNNYVNKNTAIPLKNISAEPGNGQIRWTTAAANQMAAKAYSL